MKPLLALLMFMTSFASTSEIRLLSLAEYMRLSASQRFEYVTEVRKAVFEYEKTANVKPGFFAAIKLFAEAEASDPRTCVVGGVVRALKDGQCPTTGRECDLGANSFLCGKINGEACVQRDPVGSISARCNQAGEKKELTPEQWNQIKPILEKGLNDSCRSGPRMNGPGCKRLQERMEANTRKFHQDPPHQEPPKPEPPHNTPVSEACKKDRDQGKYGTCHAFCLTCVYDTAMAKKNGNGNFKSSANWIAMLTVVERMCDNPSDFDKMNDQILDEGWQPPRTLKNLAKIGACAETSFIPYQPQGDWAGSLRSQDRTASQPLNASFPDGKAKMEVEKGLNPRPDGGYIHTGANMRPQFGPAEQASWKQKFGIAPGDAYDLFCPQLGTTMQDDYQAYPARLDKLKSSGKLDPRFAKCAEEALQNKEKIKANPEAKCEVRSLGNSSRIADDLKDQLRNSAGPIPIIISMKSSAPDPIASSTHDTGALGGMGGGDANPKKDKQGGHCITLTGYDATGFTTINSWGSNQAYSHINYDDASTVQFSVDDSCPFIGGEKEAAPSASSTTVDR